MFLYQVYDKREHFPFGAVSKSVPVFTVSSISKRFLVPGWRLGWVIVHDRAGAVTGELRSSLTSLTQRTLGPCSLLQGALPQILKSTPQSLYDHTNNLIEVSISLIPILLLHVLWYMILMSVEVQRNGIILTLAGFVPHRPNSLPLYSLVMHSFKVYMSIEIQ